LHRVHPTPPSLLLPWRGDSGGGRGQPATVWVWRSHRTRSANGAGAEECGGGRPDDGRERREGDPEAACGGGKETDGSVGRRDGKAQSHAGVRDGPPPGPGRCREPPNPSPEPTARRRTEGMGGRALGHHRAVHGVGSGLRDGFEGKRVSVEQERHGGESRDTNRRRSPRAAGPRGDRDHKRTESSCGVASF